MRARSSFGFTIIEAVLVFVIAGVITAVGLTFYQSYTKQQTATTNEATTEQSTQTTDDIPAIESASDIDAATADLEAIDIEDLDEAAQLDEQQAAF